MLQYRHTEIVYINVYNVTRLNSVFEWLGFGLYHTSVGVYGLEFSYGGHDLDQPGTVVVVQGNSAGLTLKERIPVGETHYTSDEVNQLVDYFGDCWRGNEYDPFSKNCNHFTAKLIEHMVEAEEFYLPTYINRFTKLGSVLRMWFKPLQQLVGDIVNYEGDGFSSGSEDMDVVLVEDVLRGRGIEDDRFGRRNNKTKFGKRGSNLGVDQDVRLAPVCGVPSLGRGTPAMQSPAGDMQIIIPNSGHRDGAFGGLGSPGHQRA